MTFKSTLLHRPSPDGYVMHIHGKAPTPLGRFVVEYMYYASKFATTKYTRNRTNGASDSAKSAFY